MAFNINDFNKWRTSSATPTTSSQPNVSVAAPQAQPRVSVGTPTEAPRISVAAPQTQPQVGVAKTPVELPSQPPVSLFDFVRELPGATGQVVKDIAQGMARNIGSVGVTIAGAINPQVEALQPKGRLGQAVFGKEPVKSIEQRIAEAELSIQDFARKRNMPALEKASLPLAGIGVGLSVGLDLFPPTGGKAKVEKELLDQLIKVVGEEEAKRLAQTGGRKAILEAIQKIGTEEAKGLSEQAVKQGIKEGVIDISPKVTKQTAEGVAPRAIKQTAEEIAAKQIAPELPTAPLRERGFVTSVKEAPQIAKEVKADVGGLYQQLANKETIAAAQKLVAEDINAALLKIAQPEKIDANFTTTGIELMRKFQQDQNYDAAAQVANKIAQELTTAGQSIQAASILDKLSPEAWVVRATRKLGKKLSPELVDEIVTKATKLAEIPESKPYDKFLAVSDIEESILKRTDIPKSKLIYETLADLANVPKTIKSSFFDFSASLRQALLSGIRNPKEWGEAFTRQFGAFAKEENYNKLMNEVMSHPLFKLAEEAKVPFTDINSGLSAREEAFMSSMAERIPIIGKGVRATNRAYTGLLNKLRMDTFAKLVDNAEKLGLNPMKDKEWLNSAGKLIGNLTGRGTFNSKALEAAAPFLNAIFYSPRLMASRIAMLNPVTYVGLPPDLRKEAAKTMAAFVGTVGTVLGIADVIPGVDVGWDPRSADFAKIKIGNTRYDIMGGFQQYLRIAAQVISGKYVSSATGKVITLGEGYDPLTRFDILLRGLESKEAPVFSYFSKLAKGIDAEGNPIDVPKETLNLFVPMFLSDMYDVIKDDPSMIPGGFLSLLGVGVQTYGKPDAYKKLDEINNLPKSLQASAFEQLKKEDKALAQQVAAAKRQEGFTEFDYGLTYMGVKNGQRARFLYEHFNGMPADQARAEWDDLRKKKLITDTVSEQIKFIMANPTYQTPYEKKQVERFTPQAIKALKVLSEPGFTGQ